MVRERHIWLGAAAELRDLGCGLTSRSIDRMPGYL
jgi:hypothetical protein